MQQIYTNQYDICTIYRNIYKVILIITGSTLQYVILAIDILIYNVTLTITGNIHQYDICTIYRNIYKVMLIITGNPPIYLYNIYTPLYSQHMNHHSQHQLIWHLYNI